MEHADAIYRTHQRKDPAKSVRPLSDWILVQFDAHKKRSGIIEIAGDENNSAVRTGTVLKTGPGKPTKKGLAAMEVAPGDRVAFLRWHNEHRPGKAVSASLRDIGHEIGGEVMLIRQTDILFVFEGDVTVDI